MSGVEVERAHWLESDGLAQLIADVFFDLPQTAWLVGNPVERREVMPSFFRILVDQAMTSGAVYTTRDRRAVAVWLYVTPGLTPVQPDYERRLEVATGEHVERFRRFDQVREKHHPQGAAHHYLAVLAVAEQHQGRGMGSALLAAYSEGLDREGIPAYLEAAGLRSRALYLRHGYRDLEEPFRLPEDGPAMWPMWRPPNTPPRVSSGARSVLPTPPTPI